MQLSFPKLFPELHTEATQAANYYAQLGGPEQEALRAFWAEFQEEGRPVTLPDRLKQLAELLKEARPVMEAACMSLWPSQVVPANLFDLAIHLWEGPLQVQRWKSSTAREGARYAWAMIDPTSLLLQQ